MEVGLDNPLEKIMNKVDGWLEAFVEMLPNIAVAILLLVLFIVLANLGRRLFVRLSEKAFENEVLRTLFSTIIYYTIFGLGLFIVLGVLGLEKTVTSLLAGVGVIGLALGFAFQDISANFISGIIMAFRNPFQIDDVVEANGIMGVVSRTNLRVTVLRTFQGQEVYIPNKDVLNNPIYNYTILGKRRIDLAIGISYGDPLPKVEKVVREAVSGLDGVADPDKLIFDYFEFGNSSINFMIRFWIEYPGPPEHGYLAMRKRAIMAIKEAFDENDITIPFPIRTLDFGIKGGEKLSEMVVHTARNQ
jgi:small conductance mechanosensitive channel